MQIFIITICNKNDNFTEQIIKKYTLLIKKYYQINFIDIAFHKKKKKIYMKMSMKKPSH